MTDLTFTSRRSPVYGRRGMVATSQPLAVAAGLELLAAGGSAADAAVATAAALNVTEPTSTGIGGDCFALYYDAAAGRVTALNGSGRAPAALTLDLLRRQGLAPGSAGAASPAGAGRPAGAASGSGPSPSPSSGSAGSAGGAWAPFHAHTVTVPGACAGWCDLVARHGRLTMPRILAPAIRLAAAGFPVAPITAHHWARGVERQLRHALGGLDLTIDGRAPRAGEIFRNPGLARTLQLVAEGGKAAFYEGEIAADIARAVRLSGGVLTEADLAAHTSTWDEPISTVYRGIRFWECPPNGQGLAALLALNLLEGFDLAHLDPLSPGRLHLQIEAMRLAFADARWYVADPRFSPAPLAELLSASYAADRRRLIDPRRASIDPQRGSPTSGSDTVYLSVVDDEGNACSFINSNYAGFGTGIVPQGRGFTLQNRGHNFVLDPEHPNALAPRKRPYHTIIPALATLDWAPGAEPASVWAGGPTVGADLRVGPPGETVGADPGPAPAGHVGPGHAGPLYACFGVMGGFMQPQGHVQVACALIDDAADPQAALDRPRFCITDPGAATPAGVAGDVALEEGIPAATLAALQAMGHPVQLVTGHARALFGRGQVILRDPATGVLTGGSDPRADGCAMPL